MQMYDYKDVNESDYQFAERVYIYNSVGFQIRDSAEFVVDQNGEAEINNLEIAPFNDNFDLILVIWLPTLPIAYS